MKKTKKIISFILAVIMVMSLVPMQIFADEELILEKVEVADDVPISYYRILYHGGADYMGTDFDRLYDISGWHRYNYKLYFSNGLVLETVESSYDDLLSYGITSYYVETIFNRNECETAILEGYPTVKVTVKVHMTKTSGEEEIKEFELDRAITERIVKSIKLIGDVPVYTDDYSFREAFYGREFEVEFYDGSKKVLTFDGYLGTDYISTIYHEEREEIDEVTGEKVFYRDVEFHYIDGMYCAASEKIDCPFEGIEIIDYKFDRNVDLKSLEYKIAYKNGKTVKDKISFEVAENVSNETVIGEIDGYPLKVRLWADGADYQFKLSAGYDIWGIEGFSTGETREICKCICHKNGILYFLSLFVIAFWKTLNMNTSCKCGYVH